MNSEIYRTINLHVVLYGCETWSLTLREERSLRVFENNVLRRIFGPKRDEVTGEWSKLHTEGLYGPYSPNTYYYYSGNETKMKEMGRACSSYGGEERCIR
jgi:hypothetical protein